MRAEAAIGALAALVALGCVTQAYGRKPLVDSNPVSEAMERAAHYWGSAPCGNLISAVAGSPDEAPTAGVNLPGLPLQKAAMWATWNTPLGANNYTAQPDTFTDCVVHINLRVWPSWRADDKDFRAFCKEMVHEYGHFEGHPDMGAVAGTIEYEQPEQARVPECERYRLLYGHAVFVRPTRGTPRSRRPR